MKTIGEKSIYSIVVVVLRRILIHVDRFLMKGEIIMKREYMKPVMESEEFVANEYVAACYYVFSCETATKGDGAEMGGPDEDAYLSEMHKYFPQLFQLDSAELGLHSSCQNQALETIQIDSRDVVSFAAALPHTYTWYDGELWGVKGNHLLTVAEAANVS